MIVEFDQVPGISPFLLVVGYLVWLLSACMAAYRVNIFRLERPSHIITQVWLLTVFAVCPSVFVSKTESGRSCS